VAAHDRAGPVQEIVKIQRRRCALKAAVVGENFIELFRQDRN
jgi:hypothetical protein